MIADAGAGAHEARYGIKTGGLDREKPYPGDAIVRDRP